MTEGRALTRLVVLDGEVWEAGSVPPPRVAERIRNPKCWAPAEVDPPLPWGPEGMPQINTASQAVIPAAPAGNGLSNLEEQAGGTEQSGVIPADQGNVIGRDPSEPVGQPNLASEVPGEVAQTDEAKASDSADRPALDDEADLPAEPPRSGRGASEGAWRAFAASRDVEISDNADRAAIITACRKAGVIQ